MSRTYRKVYWLGGMKGRDGFFNKSYPKYFYYSKKDKSPYVAPEEKDIYCCLYVFDDMLDMDEEYCCETCGGKLNYWAYISGWCEC